MKKTIKGFLKKILRMLFEFIILFVITTFLLVLLLRFINPPTTSYIISKNLFDSNVNNIEQIWADIESISKEMQIAVIASEDQLFADHYGFDIKQIEKAIDEKQSGKRTRGASTISQQVAKNLFLWQDKSWFRKSVEVYFTSLIELTWSKKRILEVYLNIVELGRGVFGVEAASRKYFNKSAARLSGHEAALLAAVLPSPVKRSVVSPSGYTLKRVERIQREMKNIGGVSYLDKL